MNSGIFSSLPSFLFESSSKSTKRRLEVDGIACSVAPAIKSSELFPANRRSESVVERIGDAR